MQILNIVACCLALIALTSAEVSVHAKHKHKKHHKGDADHKVHHKGHHHHHGKHHKHKAPEKADAPAAKPEAVKPPAVPVKTVETPSVKTAAVQKKASRDEELVAKMKALESRLAAKKQSRDAPQAGQILVNGPIPAGFAELFSQAVAQATGAVAKKVTVTSTAASKEAPGIFTIDFKADRKVVNAVESQVADPDSKLAKGNLHSFLVAKDDDEDQANVAVYHTPEISQDASPISAVQGKPKQAPEQSGEEEGQEEAQPVQEKGIDIDTAMPYGELEPFGREDTAQELTEDSISESNSMVDQLERAEVAEEKRAVFRALTRLRGAAITSFDGVARSQTGNIDEYNKIHQWRTTHPLHHLADEESDVSKWAFPDNADF